ncbi:MAG: GH36-type glycosyl hydrolase domain-containing protein [Lachnospiraceae bacterium]
MQYGHFDNKAREYVIDRVDLPTSWTNYIGTHDMMGVFNQTAGGYVIYRSSEYHRITRFRGNGVPMDTPGHYIYVRDNADGDYWSLSWQPVGKPKEYYSCCHGLSYIRYLCSYSGISAQQKLSIAMDDPVEIIDVTLTNTSQRPRDLSVFSYMEFSFHQVPMDNQNFQMSLYAAGSHFENNAIIYELHYEENSYQFLTSDFAADGFDCLRDTFLGIYHSEKNPAVVEKGACQGSFMDGGNHCGVLEKKLHLEPGKSVRLLYFLGEGGADQAEAMRKKYTPEAVDHEAKRLRSFWEDRLSRLQVKTPNEGMNTELNIWNLYQSEINVMFSRFTSFIEVGGRVGLGFRDTAQDAMTIPHADAKNCKKRIIQLLRALTTTGYGLHLFEPRWFEKHEEPTFQSPTVIPTPDKSTYVHGIGDACSDDAIWLVSAIDQYVKETGDFGFVDEVITYADGGAGTVYEHMKKILDFSSREVGAHGICKGLRADWNDCLNLGGGESAMVSFLLVWAMKKFVSLAERLERREDMAYYRAKCREISTRAEKVLWDNGWYIRGFTADGRAIGTHRDLEGKVHMESNTWAVISGAASYAHGIQAMDAVDKYLYTPYGLMLNAPCYTKRDDGIGFVTRVYPGLKENGSIFSHPNPWAWCAEAKLGRGTRAMKFYNALCPALQNDRIEIRKAEPYSYCQFVAGRDHKAFGTARHPFMTGSAGWSYYAATQYLLGIKPDYDGLVIDPCIPSYWKHYEVKRIFRGATYLISIDNPHGVEHGVQEITVNGRKMTHVPVGEPGTTVRVHVLMGKGEKA